MGTSWASPCTAAAVAAAESLRAHSSTHFSGRSPGNGVSQPAGSAPKPIKATPARSWRCARRRLQALMLEHLQPGFKVKHEGMNQGTK